MPEGIFSKYQAIGILKEIQFDQIIHFTELYSPDIHHECCSIGCLINKIRYEAKFVYGWHRVSMLNLESIWVWILDILASRPCLGTGRFIAAIGTWKGGSVKRRVFDRAFSSVGSFPYVVNRELSFSHRPNTVKNASSRIKYFHLLRLSSIKCEPWDRLGAIKLLKIIIRDKVFIASLELPKSTSLIDQSDVNWGVRPWFEVVVVICICGFIASLMKSNVCVNLVFHGEQKCVWICWCLSRIEGYHYFSSLWRGRMSCLKFATSSITPVVTIGWSFYRWWV